MQSKTVHPIITLIDEMRNFDDKILELIDFIPNNKKLVDSFNQILAKRDEFPLKYMTLYECSRRYTYILHQLKKINKKSNKIYSSKSAKRIIKFVHGTPLTSGQKIQFIHSQSIFVIHRYLTKDVKHRAKLCSLLLGYYAEEAREYINKQTEKMNNSSKNY